MHFEQTVDAIEQTDFITINKLVITKLIVNSNDIIDISSVDKPSFYIPYSLA